MVRKRNDWLKEAYPSRVVPPACCDIIIIIISMSLVLLPPVPLFDSRIIGIRDDRAKREIEKFEIWGIGTDC